MLKELDSVKKIAAAVDRAIVLCDKFVPVTDQTPTQHGGPVRVAAVGTLVALRAVLEAVIEEGAKEGMRNG